MFQMPIAKFDSKEKKLNTNKKVDEFLKFFPIWCYNSHCIAKQISASELLYI